MLRVKQLLPVTDMEYGGIEIYLLLFNNEFKNQWASYFVLKEMAAIMYIFKFLTYNYFKAYGIYCHLGTIFR